MEQARKRFNPIKTIIIIAVVAVLVAVGYQAFQIVSKTLSTKKLSCESTIGHITLSYRDDTIIDYYGTGIPFDLASQRQHAERIGIEEYLGEFEVWFSNNYSGTCTRSE